MRVAGHTRSSGKHALVTDLKKDSRTTRAGHVLTLRRGMRLLTLRRKARLFVSVLLQRAEQPPQQLSCVDEAQANDDEIHRAIQAGLEVPQPREQPELYQQHGEQRKEQELGDQSAVCAPRLLELRPLHFGRAARRRPARRGRANAAPSKVSVAVPRARARNRPARHRSVHESASAGAR